MRLAPAYTLTEILVVLIILALIAGVTASGAPAAFERAALRQAEAKLATDLDTGAMRARQAGAFGALAIGPNGASYAIRVGDEAVITRSLPRDVFLIAPSPLALDAAGRWAPARLLIKSKTHEIAFDIDPIVGRATRAGHGVDGSAGRRRDQIGRAHV